MRKTAFVILAILCCGALLFLTTCGGGAGGGNASSTTTTSIPPLSTTYAIGSTTRSLIGSPGSPGPLPVRIYYPADRAGTDAPAAGGRFPLIVFSHGYQQSFEDYAYVWEDLVSAGYIVALPDRLSRDATISIDAYAADITFVLAELYRIAAGGDALLGGRLETSSAFLGHSTGGGASVIAAANRTANGSHRADTVAILAPLGQTYGPITGTNPYEMAGNVDIPVLILAGGKDCICPSTDHARRIYDGLGGAAVKYLVTITNGDHCGFGDARGPGRNLCEIAETGSCPLGQGFTIATDEQNRLSAQLLRPWLDRILKRDNGAWNLFQQRVTDTRVTVNSSGSP
jgi:predicted dienelactone hydrolase